ncbi:branched-chain amino acid ABC transporter substrate-binding protein [Meridianimarinicoccus roseus]|uniref:Branched-chain amino acid ABC transporter substrate-binding protein n=1 Tax=Meridianimarinicoccus roseus TaxID=2072018 RepID=A0A2V2LLI5_9RHOB|nr:ABC transporter substrate-binding protein [Meridianimarinicoccus roseus]PWR02623.1 branched-chain amino acid ABC transporter substrate-binding protein [Meridianimarinicoccus roseus]
MLKHYLAASTLAIAMATALPAAATEIAIGYLRAEQPAPPVLSNLRPDPADLGIAGAQAGLADTRTTGQFLGHDYTLDVVSVPPGGDVLGAARAALGSSRLLLLDAPADTVLAIADLPEAQGALLFNVAAPDPVLRDAECRANVLHTVASTAMRTDALIQVLLAKRWTDIVAVAGAHEADSAFMDALDRSAGKFGLKIGKRKIWAFDADMRRAASTEVPLFTQDLGDYDVLLVADELDDFGEYILYNTWRPRPVAGSVGMTPQTWSPALEQWGAVQLQERFRDTSGRDMQPEDYAAWAALRSIGEAVTRTGFAAPDALRAYILSDEFELDGFKGRPLSYRGWNGQLRQPIPVVHPRALVALAPVEGFLHQVNELDTLGLDAPEVDCTAFGD